jgi:hypothetical protein
MLRGKPMCKTRMIFLCDEIYYNLKNCSNLPSGYHVSCCAGL